MSYLKIYLCTKRKKVVIVRADRLLSILFSLQQNEKMTTKELATQLEVTERTIHRDMDALSAAGIPVFAERGKYGGWKVVEEYKKAFSGLKESELKTLFLSPSSHLLTDLGIEHEWSEARKKLLATYPAKKKHELTHNWDRVHIDSSTWRKRNAMTKEDGLKELQQAVWNDVNVEIDYEKADGKRSTRVISPLGLVAKGSTWYVVALSNGQLRNFKVSRIHSVTMLSESFNRPVDFNLAEYWQESKQSFIENLPNYEVEALISPSIVKRLTFTGRFVQVIHLDEENEDGWFPAILSFDTKEEAAQYVLGFGDHVQINQPEELKIKVTQMAAAVLRMYEKAKQE
jgi:predicted DNA-binding transcriptional regulator YafY|nr:YafY family protein [Alkalihalophilus marmarensis]